MLKLLLLLNVLSCQSAGKNDIPENGRNIQKVKAGVESISPLADRIRYTPNQIQVGADRMSQYVPTLENKKIGLVVNPTSMVKNTHLVDTLYKKKIQITKIFGPEHGLQGIVDAGSKIGNSTYKETNIPVISLYGKHHKPTVQDLEDVDILVFDIQDVGARFYTYISTLTYVMEAAAENNKKVIVLDRPNPNGFYVDGNILDTASRSFVGMHPIPIVHGMTIGEYAKMLNGEKWLKNGIQCDLQVVSCLGYDHTTVYTLPIAPSPNLNTQQSIYLYPALCLLEGTIVSMGRGTPEPFTVVGYPSYTKGNYSFTPEVTIGNKAPLYKGELCNGYALKDKASVIFKTKKIPLEWLLLLYKNSDKKKKDFFNTFFEKLAGGKMLQKQIKAGKTEAQIRKSWEKGLKEFKLIRKKYLLYKDFE